MGAEDTQSLLNEQANTTPAPPNPVSPPPAGYAIYPPPGGYPMMYPVPVSPASVESGNAPQYMMAPHPYPPQYAPYQIPPHYPQYVPQYPAQPQQFDNCKNGNVLLGVTPDNVHTHVPMVHEEFSEQLRKFPSRVKASLNMKLPVYNDLKTYSSWKTISFCLFLQSLFRFLIAFAFFSIFLDDGFVYTGPILMYAFVGTFVSFLLSNGILHGVCMCFGGGRSSGHSSSTLYTQMSYLSAMFSTPLDLAMFATLIPFVGSMISLAFVGYKILLYVMTLRSVYGFSSGKSVGIIIGLVVTVAVIVVLLYVSILYAIFSSPSSNWD